MTLVDVPAVLAILSQHVAVGTFTVERSDSVSAPSVAAEEGHNSALVDICCEEIHFNVSSIAIRIILKGIYPRNRYWG